MPATESNQVVSPEILGEIRSAKEAAEYAQAEANKLLSDLNFLIATALRKERMPLSASTICLDCGSIRSSAAPRCPKCAVGEQAPRLAP